MSKNNRVYHIFSKHIFVTGSLSLLILLSGCGKSESVLETTSIVESQIETTTADYSVNDEIRYDVLDGMTKEEYKKSYLESMKLALKVFDENSVREDLAKIDNKKDLGEYLYDNIQDKFFGEESDSEEPLTHEEEVEILICSSGYVVLPSISYESLDEIERTIKERDLLCTQENGFIQMEDWNNFSLIEAKEHIVKVLKNDIDTYNKNDKELYDYYTSDEYIDFHIESQINAEQDAIELQKSLQEEVDAIYESQEQR